MQSSTCPICGNDPWANYFSGDLDFDYVFGPCECEIAEREAEVAAYERKLDIDIRDLGGLGPYNLQAFYCEYPYIAGMAIQPHLSDVEIRARELEAHGYFRWIPRNDRERMAKSVKEGGGLILYAPAKPTGVREGTTYAISSVIEWMEPDWVDAVAGARKRVKDPESVRAISRSTGLPYIAVTGALRHLKTLELAR